MELDTLSVQDAINDGTPIWRYMDLPKFVSMLATGELRFTKAAALRDDPYEGFSKAVHLCPASAGNGESVPPLR
jgi:hypothetical protein